MSKDAYYFSHDYNAANDPKMVVLVAEYGLEAYGLYWRIIECLAQESDHSMPYLALERYVKTLEKTGVCKQGLSTLQAMLELCLLTVEANDRVLSTSLNRRLAIREELRLKRSRAGHKGGVISSGSKQGLSTPQAKPSKERKGKETKVKESTYSFTTFIRMEREEHQKLLDTFGLELWNQELPKMSEWVEKSDKPTAKRYRRPTHNHYLFAKGWLERACASMAPVVNAQGGRNAANDKHLTFKQRDSRAVEDSARRLFLESLQLEEQQNGTIRNETSAISNGHLHGTGNLGGERIGVSRAAQALRLPHGPKGS